MTSEAKPPAGTFALEGLVEGPVPPFPGGEERLEEWVRESGRKGLAFHLSLDGGAFSLLADSEPVESPEGADLEERTREALDRLVELFPPDLKRQLFSTVRSTEERDGSVVQAIYAITSRGVEVRRREVEGAGRKPAPVQRPRGVVPYVVAGAGLLLLLAVFLLFDGRALWNRFTTRYLPIDPAEIDVDASRIDPWVTGRKIGLDETKSRLLVELARTERFPRDLESYLAEERRIASEGELSDYLAFQALVEHGRIRAEFLDEDGKELYVTVENVRGLLEEESIVVALPLRVKRGTATVRLGY